jgi:hypothetical protein
MNINAFTYPLPKGKQLVPINIGSKGYSLDKKSMQSIQCSLKAVSFAVGFSQRACSNTCETSFF